MGEGGRGYVKLKSYENMIPPGNIVMIPLSSCSCPLVCSKIFGHLGR